MLEMHKDGTPVIRYIEDLFKEPTTKTVRMIGLVGDSNKGKTNTINHIINIFQTRASFSILIGSGGDARNSSEIEIPS